MPFMSVSHPTMEWGNTTISYNFCKLRKVRKCLTFLAHHLTERPAERVLGPLRESTIGWHQDFLNANILVKSLSSWSTPGQHSIVLPKGRLIIYSHLNSMELPENLSHCEIHIWFPLHRFICLENKAESHKLILGCFFGWHNLMHFLCMRNYDCEGHRNICGAICIINEHSFIFMWILYIYNIHIYAKI